jgi:hypothetical protein
LLATVLVVVAVGCGSDPSLRVVRDGQDIDISHNVGWQAEVAVATDPVKSSVVLAASNSANRASIRIYSSRDGGRSWNTTVPAIAPAACGAGDPAEAIGQGGRQYVAFLVRSPCHRDAAAVGLAVRQGPNGRWRRTRLITSPPRGADDDKPQLTIGPSRDGGEQLSLSWTRYHDEAAGGDNPVLTSSSTDGGGRWGKPQAAGYGLGTVHSSIGIGARGSVYVVWQATSTGSLFITKRNGRAFALPTPFAYAPLVQRRRARCTAEFIDATPIPAQPDRCVTRGPQLVVDGSHGRYRGRIYVAYEAPTPRGDQDVFLDAFDPRLHKLDGFPRRVPPPARHEKGDQFLPAIAVDDSTGGVWICFYDTSPTRRRSARYACTASQDGGASFARTVYAASVASDETVAEADPFEYGEYAGVASSDGRAYAVWSDGRWLTSLAEEIYGARLKTVR